MLAVSAAELASIQAEAQAAVCDKVATIWRKNAMAQDAYGSPAPNSYSYLATTIAGVAEPTATHLQNYDYEIGSLAAWHVRLPIGTDIRYQDHLLLGGPIPAVSLYPATTLYPDLVQILEVHVILTPRSYAALLSVLAAEVK